MACPSSCEFKLVARAWRRLNHSGGCSLPFWAPHRVHVLATPQSRLAGLSHPGFQGSLRAVGRPFLLLSNPSIEPFTGKRFTQTRREQARNVPKTRPEAEVADTNQVSGSVIQPFKCSIDAGSPRDRATVSLLSPNWATLMPGR